MLRLRAWLGMILLDHLRELSLPYFWSALVESPKQSSPHPTCMTKTVWLAPQTSPTAKPVLHHLSARHGQSKCSMWNLNEC